MPTCFFFNIKDLRIARNYAAAKRMLEESVSFHGIGNRDPAITDTTVRSLPTDLLKLLGAGRFVKVKYAFELSGELRMLSIW